MTTIIQSRSAVAVCTLFLFAVDSRTLCAQVLDSAITRLQPIGAPSRVDQYRNDRNRAVETEFYSNASARTEVIATSYLQDSQGDRAASTGALVRQTAMLQDGGFAAPPSGFSPPPAQPSISAPPMSNLPSSAPSFGTSPTSPPNTVAQPSTGLPSTLPRPPQANSLPPNTTPIPRTTLPSGPTVSSSSDLQPVPQPQLGSVYANVDNCACVTGPSGYSAASFGCGSPVAYAAPTYGAAPPATYVAPPSTLVPPTLMPGQLAPISNSAAPLPSLFTLGQQYNPVQVGQGIIGQPVAYVPGQTIRNFIRYLSP